MNNKLAFATGVFAAALGTLGVLYPGAGDDLRSLYDAILFWAPVILPAAGGLLLGLLRRQTAGSTVAGALAGALGAGLATFAVAVYIVVDCSINPDACSELGAVGVLFVYLSIGAALLASSALLSGVGSWFTHFVPIGQRRFAALLVTVAMIAGVAGILLLPRTTALPPPPLPTPAATGGQPIDGSTRVRALVRLCEAVVGPIEERDCYLLEEIGSLNYYWLQGLDLGDQETLERLDTLAEGMKSVEVLGKVDSTQQALSGTKREVLVQSIAVQSIVELPASGGTLDIVWATRGQNAAISWPPPIDPETGCCENWWVLEERKLIDRFGTRLNHMSIPANNGVDIVFKKQGFPLTDEEKEFIRQFAPVGWRVRVWVSSDS